MAKTVVRNFGKSNGSYSHGMHKTRVYKIWQDIKTRCFNKNHKSYVNYGARGITMCDKWKDDFLSFIYDMGIPDDNLMIDRIDSNGNYEPKNCRWADRKTQQRNMRKSKIWHVQGNAFNSHYEAAEVLNISPQKVVYMCEGRTARGRFYPPKDNCFTEKKYKDAVL